jgi:hypothetical protein
MADCQGEAPDSLVAATPPWKMKGGGVRGRGPGY